MNKQILFLIILLTAGMVKAGNHAEPTIELQGIENGKTYESPIKLNFVVKNIKVLPAGVKEENSGHHHILLNLSELPDLNSPLPMTENIIHLVKDKHQPL